MTRWPTPLPSVWTAKTPSSLPAEMWNSIRELPLSGSSASVALMVSTVCSTGVSSARVWLPYCTQTHSDTWRQPAKQLEKQEAAGPHTYIALLKQRQLIVDVNDFDDDLTVSAVNCSDKSHEWTWIGIYLQVCYVIQHVGYLGPWLWHWGYKPAGLYAGASATPEFFQKQRRWRKVSRLDSRWCKSAGSSTSLLYRRHGPSALLPRCLEPKEPECEVKLRNSFLLSSRGAPELSWVCKEYSLSDCRGL